MQNVDSVHFSHYPIISVCVSNSCADAVDQLLIEIQSGPKIGE